MKNSGFKILVTLQGVVYHKVHKEKTMNTKVKSQPIVVLKK